MIVRFVRLAAWIVLAGVVVAAGSPALADDSCPYARNGACDEERYGGPGVCTNGTDDSDCRAHAAGNNSCQWAYDGECDHPNIGTGACQNGTDQSDCRALAAGSNDSCYWANDGECDEPGIGTGVCIDGTDVTDCRPVAYLRHRTNACVSAFDGRCDEPGSGSGRCAARTDTADCLGRSRPPGMQDHFFGHDDRIRPPADEPPWRAIGLLEGDGGSCTAALVAPRVALTAAHCVLDDVGRPVADPGRLFAGYEGGRHIAAAAVVGALANPLYDPQAPADGPGGLDWAFLELDRPLGDIVGTFSVFAWTERDLADADAGDWHRLFQAGYSWDSPDYLTGNIGCLVSGIRADDSLLHQCDTTQGDSGSPIFIEGPNGYEIVAIDSEFLPTDKGAPLNLAVDSRAFLEPLRRFIAKIEGTD